METTESPNTLVTPTLRALLAEVIDYAGLFPPAELSLDRAIRNYAEYRHDPEAWMLARFVLPVRRLPDLDAYARLFRRAEWPYHFAVLGTGGAAPAAFLDALDADLEALQQFHDDHGDRVRADVMEVRLPADLLGADARTVEAFLDDAERRLAAHGTAKLDLFYEVPYAVDDAALQAIFVAIAEHNSQQTVPARSVVGFKMRCGGIEPADVPPPEHVARVIAGCRDAGVRFKATAGLHHPVRHFNEMVGAPFFGFLNVFGAAALAVAHDLDRGALHAILTEDMAEAFQFSKERFAWRDLAADLGTLHYVRDELAISFGSCSFDDPRDDLKELELIR